MNRRNLDYYVGIDIGTTKIGTLVAKKDATDNYEIKGIGVSDSLGLRKGVVVNIEKTIASIRKSVKEAEELSGVKITKADISIAGGHIISFNNRGIIPVRNGEVSEKDVRKVITTSKMIDLPSDRKILHVIPQEFKVDDISRVKNPVGMSGSRLEVNVHIVSGAISAIKNLVKCVEDSGIQVNNIILQPMASSESVLTDEEKDLGVALIDIGGGTTDIAVWKRGSLLHTQIIPIGGNHFTNDLSLALRISNKEAESIKIEYGQVIPERINKSAQIAIKGLAGSGNKEIPLNFIIKVFKDRAEELFQIIDKNLEKKKLKDEIICGYVITGGGSLMKAMPILGEFILEKPVKVGGPGNFDFSSSYYNPQLSTLLGLLAIEKKRKGESAIFRKKFDIVQKLNMSLKNVFRDLF